MTSELLNAWERGLGAPMGERALELAALARPDLSLSELRELAVGDRDRELLAFRRRLFGDTLAAVVDCPSCGEVLEATLDAATLQLPRRAPPVPQPLSHSGYELTWRQPTAGDVADSAGLSAPDDAEAVLLDRCVVAARVDGSEVGPRDLPMEVRTALDEALAAADPQADLEITVACPDCGTPSTSRLDIATYLWAEVERVALGTLREIHVLASAYGWSEAEIIALGPRRRLYLELVEG